MGVFSSFSIEDFGTDVVDVVGVVTKMGFCSTLLLTDNFFSFSFFGIFSKLKTISAFSSILSFVVIFCCKNYSENQFLDFSLFEVPIHIVGGVLVCVPDFCDSRTRF